MLGSELRALRKAGGYKAKDLAAALDITAATLSKYEHGKASVPRKVELASRYLCEPVVNSALTTSVDALLATTVGELLSRDADKNK